MVEDGIVDLCGGPIAFAQMNGKWKGLAIPMSDLFLAKGDSLEVDEDLTFNTGINGAMIGSARIPTYFVTCLTLDDGNYENVDFKNCIREMKE